MVAVQRIYRVQSKDCLATFKMSVQPIIGPTIRTDQAEHTD
jgi:hypothetical protein